MTWLGEQRKGKRLRGDQTFAGQVASYMEYIDHPQYVV